MFYSTESQRDDLYAAEEDAEADYFCSNVDLDAETAQTLADEVVAWGKSTFGIRADLSVTVEEIVTEASATDILERWDINPNVAEVKGPLWREGSPESTVYIYTMVDAGSGHRVGASEHLMFHELAHVVVGEWPSWELAQGTWTMSPIGPDRHGALFARRHVDIVERFHPDCAPALVAAYADYGIEVAERTADPASFWSLPRPSEAEVRAALDDLGGGA